ncbi:STAS domain-containing protein [Nonomuraea sp. FMUSA5-5]|uniref:STAS domain-containing protein n=1 Tax=Nonomuraea composti TaxID=2720023 RepID=A0ABX1B8H0_9ACTN|nr:STAS domain-containing protein [Nonomuraea sp. FMUSA5-5]NJP92594.1 STAS domain-containing protein [Nonomuraea sp. FMUSA5-5]
MPPRSGDPEAAIGRTRPPGRPPVLDLGGLTDMDGTGPHVLLRVHGDLRRQGGSLHLAAVRDLPARLPRTTEVWDALDTHPSAQAAITALLRPAAPSPHPRRLS